LVFVGTLSVRSSDRSVLRPKNGETHAVMTLMYERASRYGVAKYQYSTDEFLPILRGIISPSNGKTIVKVWMTLPAFTVAFMLVWFAGVAFGAALALPALLLDHNAVGLVPIAMLGAGLAMVCLGFYPEARKAERVLRDVLEEAL
jgi:hypothetical protein